jgi:hypothetical protein
MHAKEWTRAFGWCNLVSTYSQSNKASMSVLEKNRARRSKKAPKPMGPGRTASPLFKASDAPLRQLSLPFSSLFVCLSL